MPDVPLRTGHLRVEDGNDISGPAVTAWELHRAWPGSELIVLDEGHGGPESMAALRRAIADLCGGAGSSTT
jgi:hypothetical protein